MGSNMLDRLRMGVLKDSGPRVRVDLLDLMSKVVYKGLSLPEGVMLCCPRCEAPAGEDGDCLLELIRVPSEESKTGYIMVLHVFCMKCGCQHKPPGLVLL